ncbi:phosphatase PAP2 family protein [Fulvivirga sp.]|uniref:phosphatase PAP2 family protein n=1 Tax=Fulvivirga sp. TaxID=1931237 RepID=UPI0032EDA7FB
MKRTIAGIFFMLNVTGISICCSQSKISGGDSITIHKNFEKKQNLRKATKLPFYLISAGLLSYIDSDIIGREEIAEERNESIPDFHTSTDDYLQYAPIALAYGLDLFGVEARHDLKTRTKLLIKSELLMMLAVVPLKQITHQLRPDGSNYSSFPSGHTAQAFVAATFMHKEYGHLSPWYSIGAYTIASSVGILRVLNNRHFSSDVLVGAGLGILATNFVYLSHKVKNKKKYHLIMSPIYNDRNIGLAVTMRFN